MNDPIEYQLTYFSLGSNTPIEFKSYSFRELREQLKTIYKTRCLDNGEPKIDRVFLYSYGGLENPIIISCNPSAIFRHFFSSTPQFVANAFREHHIHEYSCYEDAYKVALDMMEPHPLCYDRDLN